MSFALRRLSVIVRPWLASVVVLALGAVTIVAVTQLQRRADVARSAQLTLAQVENQLNVLQSAPYLARSSTGGPPVPGAATAGSPPSAPGGLSGGPPAFTRGLIVRTQRRIQASLALLDRGAPAPALASASLHLKREFALINGIYDLSVRDNGFGVAADRLAARSGREVVLVQAALARANLQYARRASAAVTQATAGSAVAISLLLIAFGFLYRRSRVARSTAERLAAENERLLATSQVEALTDPLTHLANRRALFNDLTAALALASRERPLLLALFDLDGFKQYNDTFGHPAGDALLARLAERLAAQVAGRGTAYRMGGDEFCVLSKADGGSDAFVDEARSALSDRGEAFAIGCSSGQVIVPVEASSAVEAVGVADQRLYEEKAGRSSASRQTTDVLLTVLHEHGADLQSHLSNVAQLARRTSIQLGLPEHEVRRIELAAELHDVGKTAIPEAILNKPGPLTETEWAFIRRHCEAGERIVRAAPSLAHTAELIRSSHERFDGSGYPDQLRGEAIPIGASVIAVCDAFDVMASGRPYRAARSIDDAIAELRGCSGSQFRPDVVDAFVASLAQRKQLAHAA